MSAQVVDASITPEQLTELIGDMETSNSMQVKVGSATPKAISLAGSKVVLPVFMACAKIKNPSQNTDLSNPFSSSN